MMKDKIISNMIEKCNIYYDNMLISSEDIIKKYLFYFSSLFELKQKITSFVFHTGSLCFDMVSLVAVIFICFTYNLNKNDDLLKSLEINDMVLYGGKRYRWGGIVKEEEGVESIVLIEDGKGKNGSIMNKISYEHNKHKVKPYYGKSKKTDGRGIRKSKSNRNEFLSYVLDMPQNDVPSTLNISVVVVADKNLFVDLCQHIHISYKDGQTIQLTDIVPISYFTGNCEEKPVGKNPAKEEAVIKGVSKVSTARDIILSKNMNKVIGMLITNIESLDSDVSCFRDLVRRKSLSFSITTSVYKGKSSEVVLKQYEYASIFACTRDMLADISLKINVPNRLTIELNKQIRNIVEREIKPIHVDGCWSWEDYKRIKGTIYEIKQSNWTDSEKEDFLLSSLALLNLFTTSFFPLSLLEESVKEGYISSMVASPSERIKKICEIGIGNSSTREQCLFVNKALLKMYEELKNENPKENILCDILSQNKKKKIALIVPKAYYVDIFNHYYNMERKYNNVKCCTANRFNSCEQYDLVIVSGDIVGKKFDILQCYASAKTVIFLYDYENKMFNYRKQCFEKIERKLNARNKGLSDGKSEFPIDISDEKNLEVEMSNTIDKFYDLDKSFEDTGIFKLRKFLSEASTNYMHSGTTEVNYVGTFVTGENILFSKSYYAVVFDRIKEKVYEVHPGKLVEGDVLVFTKKNDYTKNIVDMIFDQLIKSEKLEKNLQEAAEKSIYWKNVLRKYKECNGLTYRDLSKQFKNYGSNLRESTIRQWLDADSHIVGPRDENTFKIIAEITQNSSMLENYKIYYNACKIVRHYRRKILALIEKAINDKLSNKIPPSGSILKIVYEHVEKLSETKELESVRALEKTVIVANGFVNRPIIESEEVLL